jgi:hypothetical protein
MRARIEAERLPFVQDSFQTPRGFVSPRPALAITLMDDGIAPSAD